MKKILTGIVGISFVLAAAVSFAENTAVTPTTAAEKAIFETCKKKGLVGATLDKCYTDGVTAAKLSSNTNVGTPNTNPAPVAPNATTPSTNK